MDICKKCGKRIKFIRRKGSDMLIVNSSPIFFIPDSHGRVFVDAKGQMRTGTIVSDGIKGYTLHDCN